MRRVVVCALAGLVVAASAMPVSARDGWSPGAAAAVGAIGGFALGAALAAPRPVYVEPAPAYVPARRTYVEPVHEEVCYSRRERVWVPGWGWELRRRTVCE